MAEFGDVIWVEGREAVCVSALASLFRVLGTDRWAQIPEAREPVRQLGPAVQASLERVQAGATLVVGRVPVVVGSVSKDAVHVSASPAYWDAVRETLPDVTVETKTRCIPLVQAAPRIQVDGSVQLPSESIFGRFPGIDLLWNRGERDRALAWLSDHRLEALLAAALEADQQVHLSPIRVSGGRLNLGPCMNPSREDQWVRSKSIEAFLARARADLPAAVRSLEKCSQRGEATWVRILELCKERGKTKWAKGVIEAIVGRAEPAPTSAPTRAKAKASPPAGRRSSAETTDGQKLKTPRTRKVETVDDVIRALVEDTVEESLELQEQDEGMRGAASRVEAAGAPFTIGQLLDADAEAATAVRAMIAKRFLLPGVFAPDAFMRDTDRIEKAWGKDKSRINALAMGSSLWDDVVAGCLAVYQRGSQAEEGDSTAEFEKWANQVRRRLPAEARAIIKTAKRIGQHLTYQNQASQGFDTYLYMIREPDWEYRRPWEGVGVVPLENLESTDVHRDQISGTSRLEFLRKLDSSVWVKKRLFPERLHSLDAIHGTPVATRFVAKVIDAIHPGANSFTLMPCRVRPTYLAELAVRAHLEVRSARQRSVLEQFLDDLNVFGLREALAYLFDHEKYGVAVWLEAIFIEGYRDVGTLFRENATPVHDRLNARLALFKRSQGASANLADRLIAARAVEFGGLWSDGQRQTNLSKEPVTKS